MYTSEKTTVPQLLPDPDPRPVDASVVKQRCCNSIVFVPASVKRPCTTELEAPLVVAVATNSVLPSKMSAVSVMLTSLA